MFYLLNGLCYKYPDYCQSFDTSNMACLKCISGYMLYNGYCVLNNSTNCQVYNPANGQCWTCKNGFY